MVFAAAANAAGLSEKLLERPILVQALDSNGKVKSSAFDIISSIPGSDGTFRTLSPDLNAQSWMGACFSVTKNVCARTFNFALDFPTLYAHSSGLLNAPAGMFNNLPAFPMSYSTTIDGATSNSASISITSFSGVVDHYYISLAPAFEDKIVKFELPSAEVADRRSINEVDARLKAVSTAVFQIQMTGSVDDSSLGGVSSDKGTAFFISSDGYFLTNHHVIASQPDCLRVQRCKLRIMRTWPNGDRSYEDLDVQLMATDTTFDFALLKANLPSNSTVNFIKLEKTDIGPNLVTLGYPGDKIDQVDGNGVNRLTYSFGKLMGFRSRAYITSVYIYSGASGSPILNANTLALVALNSNGASSMGADGAPAIAQSVQEINRAFGVYKYLSGEKQRQVDVIIRKLSKASSFEAASQLLDKYLGAKTMYGRARLKMIMTNHDSRDVRRAIFQKLNLD